MSASSDGYVSWISLLRTVRAPLFVVVGAGIALLVPQQTQDMLDALSDGGLGGSGVTFSFHFTLGLLAISAWYWSRALLAARFEMPDSAKGREKALAKDTRDVDGKVLDFIPRVIFVLALLVGIGVIIRSGGWSNLPYLALWAIPLSLLVFYRLRVRAFLQKWLKRGPAEESRS